MIAQWSVLFKRNVSRPLLRKSLLPFFVRDDQEMASPGPRKRKGPQMGFVANFPAACTGLKPRACLPAPSDRVSCRVQYNGVAFHGWEAKPGLRTVEIVVADSVADVAGVPVQLIAASRTDAGTHAIGQVVHFDVGGGRKLANARAWVGALNRRLPSDVRVTEAAFATNTFDARRSALWRRYRYSVRNSPSQSVFLAPFTWHYYKHALNVPAMHAAAQSLRSATPRDMSAFRKAGAPAAHTMITVHDIGVRRADGDGGLVELDVTANWFVYGMMRLLAATLVQVGSGAISVQDFIRVVEDGRREEVRFSAPPNGLCLLEVGYPTELDPFCMAKGDDGARQVSDCMNESVYNV